LFVALLSFSIIEDINLSIPFYEYILIIWMVALIVDDAILFHRFGRSHIKLFSTKINVFNNVLFTAFIVLRITALLSQNNSINYSCHVILIFSTITCYIRLSLCILFTPILFAIIAMLQEVFTFFIFLGLFILGFTWAFMALTRFNVNDDTWKNSYPNGPVLLSIWAIFGDFEESFRFINDSFIVGPLLLALLLISVNIFLINVLIAIMNDAYRRTLKKNYDFNAYRFVVLKKFQTSFLPPPLSFLQLLFVPIYFCHIKFSTKPAIVKEKNDQKTNELEFEQLEREHKKSDNLILKIQNLRDLIVSKTKHTPSK